MPFILKQIKAQKGKQTQLFLTKFFNSTSFAQKILDKKRVFNEFGTILNKRDIIPTNHISYITFEGNHNGLMPLFTTKDFTIFDKPSGVLVHPNSRNTPYCLLDEIKYHFGNSANITHRIDKQTSGLVLGSICKKSELVLKQMWDDKQFYKIYYAIVQGCIKDKISINKPIKSAESFIKAKMKVSDDGKNSLTHIKPIYYNKSKNQTLVKIMPLTGRQHQIRVHLDFINHRIIGDPIYGVDKKISDLYLNKKLTKKDKIAYTGASRLWLQAHILEFKYNNILYKIYSKQRDIFDKIK